jgi:hypothetical protein
VFDRAILRLAAACALVVFIGIVFRFVRAWATTYALTRLRLTEPAAPREANACARDDRSCGFFLDCLKTKTLDPPATSSEAMIS